MGRWEPNAQARLRQAAMELYGSRGFDQTTVAEIAERAGLTERTFFRHFADKREVLFAGSSEFQERLVAAVASSSLPPGESVAAAFEKVAAEHFPAVTFARQRQEVIDQNPALQERELVKLHQVAALMAAALRARGVDDLAAAIAAEGGMAAFKVAFARWIAAGGSLEEHVRTAFGSLRDVVRKT